MNKSIWEDWKKEIIWIIIAYIINIIIQSSIAYFWKNDFFYWIIDSQWLFIVVLLSIIIFLIVWIFKNNNDQREKKIQRWPDITMGRLYNITHYGSYLIFGASWRYEIHELLGEVSLHVQNKAYCPECDTEIDESADFWRYNRYTWKCPKPDCKYKYISKFTSSEARLKAQKVIKSELEKQDFRFDR
jgi:ribosomal protein L37AE/L43A